MIAHALEIFVIECVLAVEDSEHLLIEDVEEIVQGVVQIHLKYIRIISKFDKIPH